MTDQRPAPGERAVGRFHDDEMAPEERDDMLRRIDAVPALREELAWLARLGHGLRHGVPANAPAGLTQRIMWRIRGLHEADHPLVALLPAMRRLAAAAAILTAVATAGFFLQRGDRETGGPAADRQDVIRIVRLDPIRPRSGETLVRINGVGLMDIAR